MVKDRADYNWQTDLLMWTFHGDDQADLFCRGVKLSDYPCSSSDVSGLFKLGKHSGYGVSQHNVAGIGCEQ